MTQRLYEEDAYISCFKATVTDCVKDNAFYKIVLDKTAFFPEGGGQAADRGFLGNAKVFDVQIKDGTVYHCTDIPVETGSTVNGKIDFDRRFAFMQNHTGEHIVSGIAHTLFGVNNVGFHLGEDFVTVDFDKELSREQLNETEYLANQKVWQNLAVKAYYPSEEVLKSTEYRSKKEIDGAVRLVEIENTDICACCAPHVKRTGEIGIIKLLDFERMRGGLRIILKCGAFALSDYGTKFENVSEISKLLSSKQENAARAVELLDQKFSDEKRKNSELKKKIAELMSLTADKNTYCIFADDCEIKDLQLIADKMHKSYGGIRAAFSNTEEGYCFAICGEENELQEFFGKFKSKFAVRGGGRGGMLQGTVNATKESIKLFF